MLIYRGSFSVFSTSVEVIPNILRLIFIAKSILHECGGDPQLSAFLRPIRWYSPRVWRWSCWECTGVQWWEVFSTSVEVIPWLGQCCPVGWSILHVCGGDPAYHKAGAKGVLYSPRMWRWSYAGRIARFMQGVFSTYVEVILLTRHLGVLR